MTQNDEARWQAVLTRDPGADGSFYYAVRSTGIYCRPTCPSRRPRRENVAFFETPEAAEQAGFRACQRCRPSEVSSRESAVARVKQLLERSETPPSLQELGEAVGMSPFHLQRVFKQATGLSPKAYSAGLRAERLKERLKEGASVTEALYEAGYGSSRALYEKAPELLGMSPGTYRKGGAGAHIRFAVADSPIGQVLVAATEQGVCAVRIGERQALMDELRAEFPRATLTEDPGAVAPYLESLLSGLSGDTRTVVTLDVKATPFQQRVWSALQRIPYGETRSYKQVAEMIGEPTAVRAVARACATNPVALVVPCHRVVRSGGDLSGYRWGVERKRVLLEMERSSSGTGVTQRD